jgi:hypothetical protein
MKISHMIAILQDVMTRTGDVEIEGACENCTTSTAGDSISVMEDPENHFVCIEVNSYAEEQL